MKAKQQAAAAAKAGSGSKSAGEEATNAGKAKPAAAEGSGGSEKGAKGEKPPKAPKGGGGAAEEGGEDVEDCCKLDFRVGTIVDAFPHPESEKLWVEKIDVGEEGGPRNICSGLRAFYATAQDLIGQSVVVVANLKNKKMGGVDSFGMVIYSSTTCQATEKERKEKIEVLLLLIIYIILQFWEPFLIKAPSHIYPVSTTFIDFVLTPILFFSLSLSLSLSLNT